MAGSEQTRTCESKNRKELAYEFQEYIFMLAIEENGMISGEGKNQESDVNFYMAVYVKTISGHFKKARWSEWNR